MGKLVNGINGPFIGKVGNTIGSSWRGISYIKSLSRRKKPATEGEKINRFIFGMTQQWLFPLKEFLRVGFNNYTLTNQGVNAAKSFLYKNALIKDGFDSRIDPTLMKVSHGELPLPARIDVELTDDNRLIFTWDTAGKKINELDQVMLMAYDIKQSDAAMKIHGQFREIGHDELDISMLENFVVYAAFVSADRESQSDSVYLGSFTNVEIAEDEEDTDSQSKSKDAGITAGSKTKAVRKSADSAEKTALVTSANASDIKISTQSADNPEIEFVPENQLSLFDLVEEVPDNQAQHDLEIPVNLSLKDEKVTDHTTLSEAKIGIKEADLLFNQV